MGESRRNKPQAVAPTAVALQAEIVELKHALLDAEERAHIDPLTRLANRRRFDAALAAAEARAQREGISVGIVVLDLDGLKITNVREGHEAGDGLLVLTGEVLARCARVSDLPARLCGDEFGVLVYADADGVRAMVRRLQQSLVEAGVAASLGWAMHTEDVGIQQTVCAADAQLNAVKRAGGRSREQLAGFHVSARCHRGANRPSSGSRHRHATPPVWCC